VPAAQLLAGTLFMKGGVQDMLSGGSFTYATPDVGTGKTLLVSAINVLNGSGSANSNYLLTYVNNTASVILAANNPGGGSDSGDSGSGGSGNDASGSSGSGSTGSGNSGSGSIVFTSDTSAGNKKNPIADNPSTLLSTAFTNIVSEFEGAGMAYLLSLGSFTNAGTQSTISYTQMQENKLVNVVSSFGSEANAQLGDAVVRDRIVGPVTKESTILISQSPLGSNGTGRLLAIAKSKGLSVQLSGSDASMKDDSVLYTLSDQSSDGVSPPTWLTIDQATQTLSSLNVPLEDLPVQVKIKMVDGTQTVSESLIGLAEF
jgi:hypothetical protein